MRSGGLVVALAVLSLASCGKGGSEESAAVPSVPRSLEGDAACASRKPGSSRALTSADVEKFLEIYPAYAADSTDPVALLQTLRNFHVDPEDWIFVQARILFADAAINLKNDKLPDEAKADVEVVRPYRARIDAAIKAK